jgi:uncharacterized membrane protein YfcA
MGGGGSILTVPILRYVLGMPTHEAIALSMLVVGTTSLAALIPHARHKRVQWRVGIAFGFAGMLGAFFAARLNHAIPGVVLLSAFAIMMFATAFAMLRQPQQAPERQRARSHALWKIAAEGFGVGAVTGLLGAGGGFAIVPALVLLLRLPMDIAVGTSLVVIAMNSFAGVVGVVGKVQIDATVAVSVSIAAVIGSVGGGAVAGRISPARLKKGFAWFVVTMAFFILAQELPELAGRTPSLRVSILVSVVGTTLCSVLTRLVQKGSGGSTKPPAAETLPGGALTKP